MTSNNDDDGGIACEQVPTPTMDIYDGDHDDVCEICGDTGTLVCCLTCCCVAHKACDLTLAQTDALPEKWQCRECVAQEYELLLASSSSEGGDSDDNENDENVTLPPHRVSKRKCKKRAKEH